MSTKPQVSRRLEIIDAMRGLAVIAMLILHSAHGWVQPELRTGPAWYWITSIGGLSAPLFFLVTGISLGLRWQGPEGAGTRHEVARGLSLLVLGYLLRVQMWLIDVPALLDPRLLGPAMLLCGGYLGLYRAGTRWAPGNTLWPTTAIATGIAWVASVSPTDLKRLLRFDVLQGLGLSLVVLALVVHGARSAQARIARAAVLGAVVLGLTPVLRSTLPGVIPPAAAAALGPFAPGAPGGWAMFPLAPWSAYACVGMVVGTHLQGGVDPAARTRRMFLWAAIGATIAGGASETWPHVARWIDRTPLIATVIRVAYRCGLGLASAGLAFAASRRPGPARALVSLGQGSLWVYWIHLEFTFGALGTPARKALTYRSWAILLGALVAAMLVVAWLRGRHRETRPGRRPTSTRSGLSKGVTNLGQGA
ncbi:MAG: heparan-alpha-glucosaminide N-acetyltransferase domain-containing protein [Myxococcales bacterium]|nr:heparan-alpha-glucosaminide N-acetyltransferase domain-containing protein [Myxococcales bacterium]MDD9967648.1 heparan-alpha-glucosaminide N-acetyltransferase domain-containing protein [Myxococcales bacterium]